MIQYVVECIAFQLVFLMVYDFFLKKETFFQWNRVYLIGSYVLSLLLPVIKITALKTSLPEDFIVYPEYLWQQDLPEIVVTEKASNWFLNMPLENRILAIGMCIASLIFGYKLYQLRRLKKEGEIQFFSNYTQVLLEKSTSAFSFFKTIFMGDQIKKEYYESILAHELVHIKQKHTYDLMFFEVMRIINWFNPLVYIYQKRISELHEFIADSQVSKKNKKEQYQILLSQVFQTQNISFINTFFKSSIIKKRIVMLQKSKSKRKNQLKYLVLVPLVLGMLFYTSSAQGTANNSSSDKYQLEEDAKLIEELEKEIKKEIATYGTIEEVMQVMIKETNKLKENEIWSKRTYFKTILLYKLNAKNTKVVFGDDVEQKASKHYLPLPSTPLYERYVKREKAFRVLDRNLDISLRRDEYYLELVSPSSSYPKNFHEFKVKNLKKLSGNEIKLLNTKIDAVFKGGGFEHNLILKDGEKTVKVYRTKNIYRINEEVQEKPFVPFSQLDKVPVFPGCENKEDKRACFNTMMQKHIAKHFSYPVEAQEIGIQGRVSILLTISKTGEIVNIRKRGPHELLEKEAVRIISKLPKMKPGVHKGNNVDVGYSIPITFKLVSGNEVNKKSSGIEIQENTVKLKMDNPPLILVDGIEITKEEMEKIDTDRIESINVLKDKMATEKYGKKGKNGVIEITLKK
ncbi:M56 family metallopeptidase [uncultured Maribacter sp.]|uniref:M56 family metallopeptidase n=1 Tax=uncultured Maribacter sp. TaxID=431308 RepID=UPI002634D6AC|nr:M56 family metallopeptidase [uncultured Maribacter sp.]